MTGLVLLLDGSAEGSDLAAALRTAGHEVTQAEPEEGRAVAAQRTPALVVLDADAPGALSLCSILRAGAPALPILLVGHAGRTLHSTADAIVRGADAFFPRPVDGGRMQRKIQTLLGDRPPAPSPPAPDAVALEPATRVDEPRGPQTAPDAADAESFERASWALVDIAAEVEDMRAPAEGTTDASAESVTSDAAPDEPAPGEPAPDEPAPDEPAPDEPGAGDDGVFLRLHGRATRAGSLDETDLPRLLAAAWAGRVSGRLRLREGAADKVLHLEEGQVVLASSNLVEDRLVEVLWREGRIPRASFEEVRAQIADSGRRAGAIFVEHGILRHEELFPLVRHHFEGIVWSVFGWETGLWSLETNAAPSGEQIQIEQPTPALILEGVRRKFSAARLARSLGGPFTVLRARAAGLCPLGWTGVHPDEEDALGRCDGTRTLAEITPPGAEVDLTAALYGLFVLGFVEVVTQGAAEVVSGPEREELAALRLAEVDRARLLERARAARIGDYFAVLGLGREATGYEVRRAYLELRRALHPGKEAPLPDDLGGVVAELDEMVDEAYEVLRDPVLRSAYVAHLP